MANVPQNLSFGVPHESFESNVTVVDSKQRSNPFDVVISQKSYLCTGSHDYTKPDFPIYAKKIIQDLVLAVCKK